MSPDPQNAQHARQDSARPVLLPAEQWRYAETAHRRRTDRWLVPLQERRARGEEHAVLDFLFTYYHHRPARLRRWDPGAGVVLEGAEAWLHERTHYVRVDGGITVDPALAGRRAATVHRIRHLLEATASRPPSFGCFGLHEWAMVYRADEEDVRHTRHPLRLGRAATDEVVEALPLRCSHYDAYRFFTPAAEPRNAVRPSRSAMPDLEQPGCLHTNMDLYKYAYTLWPLICSDLVADCFDLAVRVRTLDMEASPYDLTGLGYDPIPIETASGRAEYVRRQRAFSTQAAHLRDRLLAALPAV